MEISNKNIITLNDKDDKKFEPLKVNINVPFIVGYTTKHGNTSKMVQDVKNLKVKN